MEVLKRLVELGFGVAIVPALAARREVAARALAAVPLRGVGGRRSVGLLTPAKGPLPRAAAAFVEITRALLVRRPKKSR